MDKRTLILGGTGMLGHRVWLTLRERFDTFVTVRQPLASLTKISLFDRERIFDNCDLKNPESSLIPLFEKIKPDIVINCAGIVKQVREAKDPVTSILINTLLPHQLANMGEHFGFKLIHISTDCIFDGKKGNYTEDDIPTPVDLYGKTKLLGETTHPQTLTLRTSMIGRELSRHSGLLEWFLARKSGETINGYTKAIFSGFTTTVLADTLGWIIKEHSHLSGIYHLSSNPICKYDLLKKLQKAFRLDIGVRPFDDFHCDRSLNGSRFNKATGFKPPSWEEMIKRLVQEDCFYKEVNYVLGR